MSDKISVKNCSLGLIKGDITDLEIESFVFYAQHNLALGSGYGSAIAMRGGPTVQEELNGLSALKTTEVVVTKAGNMKAKKIVHAVGPRFQEQDLGLKLKQTVENSLKIAEDNGIKNLAFPAMGVGFYGIPLPLAAQVTIDTCMQYMQNGCKFDSIVICLLDTREYKPFEDKLNSISQ